MKNSLQSQNFNINNYIKKPANSILAINNIIYQKYTYLINELLLINEAIAPNINYNLDDLLVKSNKTNLVNFKFNNLKNDLNSLYNSNTQTIISPVSIKKELYSHIKILKKLKYLYFTNNFKYDFYPLEENINKLKTNILLCFYIKFNGFMPQMLENMFLTNVYIKQILNTLSFQLFQHLNNENTFLYNRILVLKNDISEIKYFLYSHTPKNPINEVVEIFNTIPQANISQNTSTQNLITTYNCLNTIYVNLLSKIYILNLQNHQISLDINSTIDFILPEIKFYFKHVNIECTVYGLRRLEIIKNHTYLTNDTNSKYQDNYESFILNNMHKLTEEEMISLPDDILKYQYSSIIENNNKCIMQNKQYLPQYILQLYIEQMKLGVTNVIELKQFIQQQENILNQINICYFIQENKLLNFHDSYSILNKLETNFTSETVND